MTFTRPQHGNPESRNNVLPFRIAMRPGHILSKPALIQINDGVAGLLIGLYFLLEVDTCLLVRLWMLQRFIADTKTLQSIVDSGLGHAQAFAWFPLIVIRVPFNIFFQPIHIDFCRRLISGHSWL